MAIYDCLKYFNEEQTVDHRLNIFDNYVDYCVIYQSQTQHQCKYQNIHLAKNQHKKFKCIKSVTDNQIIHQVYVQNINLSNVIEENSYEYWISKNWIKDDIDDYG